MTLELMEFEERWKRTNVTAGRQRKHFAANCKEEIIILPWRNFLVTNFKSFAVEVWDIFRMDERLLFWYYNTTQIVLFYLHPTDSPIYDDGLSKWKYKYKIEFQTKKKK